MGMKVCLLQIGYDLELQYNALKTFIPNDITFDRFYLIDYYIKKQLDIFPRRDKQFADLFTLGNKRHVCNFQQFLPIFLLMLRNYTFGIHPLYKIEARFKSLQMDRLYNFDMIEKMWNQSKSFLTLNNIDSYDVICIGTTDGGVYSTIMAILQIKIESPDKKIVIGGKQFKSYKEIREILYRTRLVDSFVDGDGEQALADLIKTQDFQKNIKVPVKNLNHIPRPEPGFDSFLWNNKHGSANIYSSRGCIYNCSFCTEGIYKFKCISAHNLVDDIKRVVRDFGIYRIVISDNLICPSKHYIETVYKGLEELIGKITIVFVQLPSRDVDEDIIKMFKRLNARVFIGIESFSQNILNKMNKGSTVEHNIDVVEKCMKHGLDFDMGRIVMFPGETMDEFLSSIKYFTRYLPSTMQSVWLNGLVLYSNTPIYKNPEKYGIQFEYFNEQVIQLVPEVSDIVREYPCNYIDLSDPDDEIFDRKNKILRVTNEVLSRIFEKKWRGRDDQFK